METTEQRVTQWEYSFNCDGDAARFMGMLYANDVSAVRSGNSVVTGPSPHLLGPWWQVVQAKEPECGGFAAHALDMEGRYLPLQARGAHVIFDPQATSETRERLHALGLDEEPTFTLRAQDVLAVETLQYWIDRARREHVNLPKLEAARRTVDAMRVWQRQHATKLPD
ncbi:MAG: hypothetical protein KGL39_49145 [Patescibacteria group bacterium]|nr:hypothetical protein [Patescibacteria group bacterium]